MGRARIHLVGTALAASGLLASTAPATSAMPRPALPRHVRDYAASYHVSGAEAARRLAYQQPAGELDAALARQLGATYAGLWLQHTPAFRVVVAVTDPAAVRRVTATATSFREVLDVRVVRYSLRDLESAALAGSAAVRRAGFAATSETDVTRNRAVVSVADVAAVRRAGVRLPASVHLAVGLGSDFADMYAGLTITGCTSGYTVRNGAGVQGVTTAAHCPNAQAYGTSAMTFQAERNSGDTDAQWHTLTTYTMRPWSKDGFTTEPTEPGYRSIRAVIGRDSQPVGGYVCKYGYITLYTCGTITTKTYQPDATMTTTLNPTPTYVRVHKDGTTLADHGDSGGPVFFGTDAYGLVKGGELGDFWYTAINYVQASLGLTVLTQANANKGWILSGTTFLYPYDYMVSPDGRYVARMQNDGNFVLYKPGNIAVWATGTNTGPNAGATARMQSDGNFVLYKPGNTAIWKTNTTFANSTLELQNDCNLVVYAPGHIAKWASNTANC